MERERSTNAHRLPSALEHATAFGLNFLRPNIATPLSSPRQLISACNSNPGYGLHPNQGRGAPEIDIFEIMGTQWKWGGLERSPPIAAYISTSLQISPGVPWSDPYRPQTGSEEWGYMNGSQYVATKWYKGLKLGAQGVYNEFYGMKFFNLLLGIQHLLPGGYYRETMRSVCAITR